MKKKVGPNVERLCCDRGITPTLTAEQLVSCFDLDLTKIFVDYHSTRDYYRSKAKS